MRYSFTALFFVSILVSSGSILPLSFAQNSTAMLSPLKQLKNGISTYNIECEHGFVLVTKTSNNSPACVKPQTAQKIIELGWKITETVPVQELSQEQAFQIVRSDLLRHIPTLENIRHYGDLTSLPDFNKHPLYLMFEDSHGIQFRINSTDHSLMAIWDPKKTMGPISDDHRIQLIKNKLVYIVPADAFAKDMYLATNYLVDARNGNIVYSDLLENVLEQNKTENYKP